MYAKAARPRPTVMAVETAAYMRDLAVSLTKQCLGILFSTSAMVGNCFSSALSALPFMPE